jgi:peptide-N4-(N-acetyl-beta-glucosaminyl)asparagine amidase
LIISLNLYIFDRTFVTFEFLGRSELGLNLFLVYHRQTFKRDLVFLKMSVNLDLASRCERNSKKSYIGAVTIFLKLLTNILDKPSEEKFRKFKKSNHRISTEFLSVDGMTELILDVGFELDGDEFVLRRGGLGVINKLKSNRDFFQKRLDFVTSSSSAVSKGAVQKVMSRKSPVVITASQPFHERIRFPQVLKTSNEFLVSLEKLSDSTMQYEDEVLQKSAIELMPTEKFKLNAIEKLRKIQKLIKSGDFKEEEPPLDDLILEELAAWFKVTS